jgi:hypothetical protein
MAKPASTHTLQQEANAARALKDALAAIPNMDDETVRDTIEGETSLHEAIAAVMADINEDEILCHGLAVMIKTMCDRQSRLLGRTEARRLAIQKAMEIGEIRTLATPSGTLSLRATPRGLDVTDEKAIPWDYYDPQEPKLNRKRLKDALKDGKEIPGCMLDNGGQTLSIRRA